MFKALLLGFVVGVLVSPEVRDRSAGGIAAAQQELRTVLQVDAYGKIAAALR